MSNIPTDLIRDILLRLPLQDLARFKCVSKPWRQTISDASFVNSKLLLQKDGDTLFIANGRNLFSISLSSLYNNNNNNINNNNCSECETNTIEPKIVRNVSHKGIPRVNNFPIASCNGLVLASHHGKNKNCALWNPLTGECRKLPAYPTPGQGWNRYALGYDEITDDYKIVREFISFGGTTETIIYSLKLDEWHKINLDPECCSMTADGGGAIGLFLNSGGVFVNGVIHWATYVKQGGVYVRMIMALDLSTEKHRHITLPSMLEPGPRKYYLSVLNDCLVLSHVYDAWILNDYGGEEIWTKFLSLKSVGITFSLRSRVLAYIKSEEQVLIQGEEDGFLWYCLKTGCVKKVTVEGLKPGFSSQVFPTSLIQFDGSHEEGTLKRPRKRLKLELTTSDV